MATDRFVVALNTMQLLNQILMKARRIFPGCIGVILLLLIVLGIAAAFLLLQARAAPRGRPDYVSLGSSFAAGAGLGPLQKGSPILCARGTGGYPRQLSAMLGISLVDMSCGGATSAHVLSGGQFFQGPQIRAIGASTRLVTLTVGGNDIGYIGDLSLFAARHSHSLFGRLTRYFWKGPAQQRDYLGLTHNLLATLQAIHRRAPKATIVVATYPAILPPSGTCPRLGLSEVETDLMRIVADRLAAITRDSARRGGAILVDMNALGATHNACSAEPWTRGWTNGAIAPFHPTQAGAEATARAIADALRLSPAGVPAVDDHDAAGHQARRIGRQK